MTSWWKKLLLVLIWLLSKRLTTYYRRYGIIKLYLYNYELPSSVLSTLFGRKKCPQAVFWITKSRDDQTKKWARNFDGGACRCRAGPVLTESNKHKRVCCLDDFNCKRFIFFNYDKWLNRTLVRSPHHSLSAFQLLRKNVISQSPIAVTAKKILTRAGAAAGTPLHMFMYQCNHHMLAREWLLTVGDNGTSIARLQQYGTRRTVLRCKKRIMVQGWA